MPHLMKVAAAAATILLTAGCSEGPAAGRVHNVSYQSGYTSLMPCGKALCPMYHGPAWSLDIYADNGAHGWRTVDETTYHRCGIGERYPDCASGDES